LNLGQLLSLPFFLIGLLLIFFNMFRLKHLRCSDRQETPSSSR
jgi:hypothetical protein